jgi:hypothetical protein
LRERLSTKTLQNQESLLIPKLFLYLGSWFQKSLKISYLFFYQRKSSTF